MKASIHSLFPFFSPCASGCLLAALTVGVFGSVRATCTGSLSERKSKEGVKLTSPFENMTIQSRFHTFVLPINLKRDSNFPKNVFNFNSGRREAERRIFDSLAALPSRVVLHLRARHWRRVNVRVSSDVCPLKQTTQIVLWKHRSVTGGCWWSFCRPAGVRGEARDSNLLEVRAKVSALPCFQPDMKLWERLSSMLRSKRTTHLLLFDCPAQGEAPSFGLDRRAANCAYFSPCNTHQGQINLR